MAECVLDEVLVGLSLRFDVAIWTLVLCQSAACRGTGGSGGPRTGRATGTAL